MARRAGTRQEVDRTLVLELAFLVDLCKKENRGLGE